jgi:hypothetical protein
VAFPLYVAVPYFTLADDHFKITDYHLDLTRIKFQLRAKAQEHCGFVVMQLQGSLPVSRDILRLLGSGY